MNPTMDQGLPQQQTVTSPPRWPGNAQVLTGVNNIKLVVMQCVVSWDGTSLRWNLGDYTFFRMESHLPPLFPVFFINDLSEVTNSEVRLFADDCLLCRPIFSRKNTEDLQQDLAALEDWEKQWQMHLRFLLMVTPRYLLESTTSSWWLCSV
jgi:hypothetical protein